MTDSELLAEYDNVCRIREQLPSGSVARHQHRSRDYVTAYLDRTPFDIVLQVSLGPRGGIHGHALLLDRRIKPHTDAIQVAALDDISRDSLCPLGRICWSHDRNTQIRPSPAQIVDFLAECLQAIPPNISSLEQRFRDPSIRSPSDSVYTLSGGAPGLHK